MNDSKGALPTIYGRGGIGQPIRRRYEVPAVILVDADSPDEAHEKSLALGATIDKEEGPGAFFRGVTVAAVDLPKGVGLERERESLGEHAESLQTLAGVQ